MEFHEKLQQLRKKHNLTQEQLAQQLFVSRTAVSKWESGRGYPNLESLKCISRVFSVSIDALLSNDELLELAQTENKDNLHKLSGLVFGILDLMTAALLFMPLVGQREGDYVRAVTLLEHTGLTRILDILYVFSLAVISAFGAFELVLQRTEKEKLLSRCKLCSLALYAAAIVLFALSRQPYLTAFLFLLLMVKVVLILQENHIK